MRNRPDPAAYERSWVEAHPDLAEEMRIVAGAIVRSGKTPSGDRMKRALQDMSHPHLVEELSLPGRNVSRFRIEISMLIDTLDPALRNTGVENRLRIILLTMTDQPE